jgi:hypothetical protein
MSTTGFDRTVDPYSATYAALTKGVPSWSGGYKCITINGQPALAYLEYNQMSWSDRYNFFRGIGDFSATKIAEVLQDDKMIAGIRRRFFSKVAKEPGSKNDLKSALEKNVKAALKKATTQVKPEDIAFHIVGDPPSARTKATQKVALVNLFQTDAALKDLERIVTAAERTSDLDEANLLMEEVFSYALPDEQATPEVDMQIARGMASLLEKGASVEDIFELFKKGYPQGADSTEIDRRFFPLILSSLSWVDYPIEPMKTALGLLKTAMPKSQDFIQEVEQFVHAIERNKKGKDDICFLVVPLLLKNFSSLPTGEVGALRDAVSHLDREYQLASRDVSPFAKASIPGLKAFSLAVGQGFIDIELAYGARSKILRSGNDTKDFPAFFHHVLESASYSDAPAKVLQKGVPLFLDYLTREEYRPFFEDLRESLSILMSDAFVIPHNIVPLLEALIPKHGLKPSKMPGEAQRELAGAMLSYARITSRPAAALLPSLPILRKQLPPDPATDDLFKDIGVLLNMVDAQRAENSVVKNMLVPLLDQIIPQYGKTAEIDIATARETVAMLGFLVNQGSDLASLITRDLVGSSRAVRQAVIDLLWQAKDESVASVMDQTRQWGGVSEEFACKISFIPALGRLLAFGGKVNIGVLPMIRRVFFEMKERPSVMRAESSAPPSLESMVIPRRILEVLLETPDSDYSPFLRQAGVPQIIRAWK